MTGPGGLTKQKCLFNNNAELSTNLPLYNQGCLREGCVIIYYDMIATAIVIQV